MESWQSYKGISEKLLDIDSDRFLSLLYNIFCSSFNDCIKESFIVNSFAPQRNILDVVNKGFLNF